MVLWQGVPRDLNGAKLLCFKDEYTRLEQVLEELFSIGRLGLRAMDLMILLLLCPIKSLIYFFPKSQPNWWWRWLSFLHPTHCQRFCLSKLKCFSLMLALTRKIDGNDVKCIVHALPKICLITKVRGWEFSAKPALKKLGRANFLTENLFRWEGNSLLAKWI